MDGDDRDGNYDDGEDESDVDDDDDDDFAEGSGFIALNREWIGLHLALLSVRRCKEAKSSDAQNGAPTSMSGNMQGCARLQAPIGPISWCVS